MTKDNEIAKAMGDLQVRGALQKGGTKQETNGMLIFCNNNFEVAKLYASHKSPVEKAPSDERIS